MNVRSLARLFILIFSIVLVATGCGTYFNLKIESTDPSSSQNQNGDGSSSENSDETGNPNNPNNPNNNGQSGSTALPELSFSISSKTISESDLLESANIQLSKASTTDINISYSVTGSAVYSSDHNLTDGSITISAGSTFIQLPLQILDDAIPDGAKQIVLTLNSSSAVQLVNPSTITITVTDDDIYPTYALDVSFGTLGSGLFKTSLDYTQGFGAAMDSQDRILVAGARSLSGSNNDLLIWRVTSQGTADLTFNGIGYHQWNNWNYDFGYDVINTAGDKPLVVGSYDPASSDRHALWKFTSGGVLDTTFSGDGRTELTYTGDTPSFRMDFDSVNNVYYTCGYRLGGSFAAISSFTLNGGVNNTFSGDGKFTTNLFFAQYFQDCKVDKNQNLVAVGWMQSVSGAKSNLYIARYTSSGTLDLTFNGTGYATIDGAGTIGTDDNGNALYINSNNEIFVVGSTNNGTLTGMAIWKFKQDGTLDTSFNGTGYLADYSASTATVGSRARSISPEPGTSNLIIAGLGANPIDGNTSDVILWRVNRLGQLDTSFSSTGYINLDGGDNKNDSAARVMFDSQNRMIVAGYSENASSIKYMTVWRFSN